VLSGYLKDLKTGQPLSNVLIKVQNKKINTYTDAEGYYKLTVPVGVNFIETDYISHNRLIKK